METHSGFIHYKMSPEDAYLGEREEILYRNSLSLEFLALHPSLPPSLHARVPARVSARLG